MITESQVSSFLASNVFLFCMSEVEFSVMTKVSGQRGVTSEAVVDLARLICGDDVQFGRRMRALWPPTVERPRQSRFGWVC